MNHEYYINLAIEQAHKSEKADGAPIGAILVQDEKIIATGWSLVWPLKDPSAHAETMCIRAACKQLQTLDLTGCTLYSTLESCSMCLGCAGWANLSRIVFGAYKEDVADNPYELEGFHAIEHGHHIQLSNGNHLEVIGGILREECKALMSHIHNWTPES